MFLNKRNQFKPIICRFIPICLKASEQIYVPKLIKPFTHLHTIYGSEQVVYNYAEDLSSIQSY